jgi:hypothetical protein
MQHAGPQHFSLAAGLTARIKALMSFPSTWVFTGQREHFIGHVEAVGLADWANTPRGFGYVKSNRRLAQMRL